ncbi:hypothetical protein X971_4766 [Agrobacterium tumefaciens LBA4213 (Ach5)]|nr:hypothetical protein X971_4766 [Agrobacterium tumefaciens LBA4213 (Ach5)]CUW98041.1 conserved hypothetical protein [Agrobacterium fabacearum TT111]
MIAYEDYMRLAKRDRRVELSTTLGDDDLAATEASQMEPGLEHLNAELLRYKHSAD